MGKISAIVITYNEQQNIDECLQSLSWADEIIVIDSYSTDNTINIAKKYTGKIIEVDNSSFGHKKNIGIEQSTGEWILWIDADERITETLKNEIIAVINKENSFDAYYINRKSFFINKFINHSGWFPDYTLRLFKKSINLKFNDAEVHEKIEYNGKPGKLKNLILHYTDYDFEHYISKLNSYTTHSAIELAKKNKKSGIADLIFRPVFTFLKMYFVKLGFLDGYTGLILCILSSYHVFFKYAKNSS